MFRNAIIMSVNIAKRNIHKNRERKENGKEENNSRGKGNKACRDKRKR